MITPILALTLVSAPAQPPVDRWFAEDKLKHFVASFVISSLSVSGARLAGFDRSASIAIGIGVGVVAGAAKEIRDVRTGGPLSYRDIIWDLAGVAASAAVADASR